MGLKYITIYFKKIIIKVLVVAIDNITAFNFLNMDYVAFNNNFMTMSTLVIAKSCYYSSLS